MGTSKPVWKDPVAAELLRWWPFDRKTTKLRNSDVVDAYALGDTLLHELADIQREKDAATRRKHGLCPVPDIKDPGSLRAVAAFDALPEEEREARFAENAYLQRKIEALFERGRVVSAAMRVVFVHDGVAISEESGIYRCIGNVSDWPRYATVFQDEKSSKGWSVILGRSRMPGRARESSLDVWETVTKDESLQLGLEWIVHERLPDPE